MKSECSKLFFCYCCYPVFSESLNTCIWWSALDCLQNAGGISRLPLQIHYFIMDGSGYSSGMHFDFNIFSSCSFCRFLFLFSLNPICSTDTCSLPSYFVIEAWFNLYLLIANPDIKLLQGRANKAESEQWAPVLMLIRSHFTPVDIFPLEQRTKSVIDR